MGSAMTRRRQPRRHEPATDAPAAEAAPVAADLEPPAEPPHHQPSAPTAPRWLLPKSPALVYCGVGLVAAGIALVGYTWLRVSGLISVPLQLPYVASSGFTGVGFVVVGSLVVNVATKRRDTAERAKQLEELVRLLAAVSTAVERRGGGAS